MLNFNSSSRIIHVSGSFNFVKNRGILSDKSLRRRIIPGMDDLRKEDSREQYFILTTFPSDRYFK